jgi:hypothetical protein
VNEAVSKCLSISFRVMRHASHDSIYTATLAGIYEMGMLNAMQSYYQVIDHKVHSV